MSDVEEWRPITNFEGRYEVSDHGRVRSVDRIEEFFQTRWGCVVKRRYRGRVLQPGESGRRTKAGKVQGHHVSLGACTIRKVHTLVLETFVGPCPPNMEGCHDDGNATNNRLSNLRWDTSAANTADSISHGTMIRGERQHCAKLTEDDVRCIRAEPDFHGVLEMLARAFGVGPTHIGRIRSGRAWAHVEERL